MTDNVVMSVRLNGSGAERPALLLKIADEFWFESGFAVKAWEARSNETLDDEDISVLFGGSASVSTDTVNKASDSADKTFDPGNIDDFASVTH
jgi:hypothetical protein